MTNDYLTTTFYNLLGEVVSPICIGFSGLYLYYTTTYYLLLYYISIFIIALYTYSTVIRWPCGAVYRLKSLLGYLVVGSRKRGFYE